MCVSKSNQFHLEFDLCAQPLAAITSIILLCLLDYVHFCLMFRQCRTVLLGQTALCFFCPFSITHTLHLFTFFGVSTMFNSSVDILVLVRIWSPFLFVSSCWSTNIFFEYPHNTKNMPVSKSDQFHLEFDLCAQPLAAINSILQSCCVCWTMFIFA